MFTKDVIQQTLMIYIKMKKIFLIISIVLVASLAIAGLTANSPRDRDVYLSKEDKNTLSDMGITAPNFTNITCPRGKKYKLHRDILTLQTEVEIVD